MNQKVKTKINAMQGLYKELTLQNIADGICQQCKNDLPEDFVLSAPSRHATSPNPPTASYPFCSTQHADLWNKSMYAELADLDRNASDSECFEHISWEKQGKIKLRRGKCKITNKEYLVEPLQPSESSGQPKECTEHFILLQQYKKYL